MAQVIPKFCPICQKPVEHKYRPFCSARCADVDLGGWLTEKYSVPVVEDADDEVPQVPGTHAENVDD